MKRKILISVIFIALGVGSMLKAQFRVGPGFYYETNIENLGIGVTGEYEITQDLSVGLSYIYYLKKEEVKQNSFNANAYYNLVNINGVGPLYALGGVSLDMVKAPRATWRSFDGMYYITHGGGTNKYKHLGLNLGLGTKVKIKGNAYIQPEANMKIRKGGVFFKLGARLMFDL